MNPLLRASVKLTVASFIGDLELIQLLIFGNIHYLDLSLQPF